MLSAIRQMLGERSGDKYVGPCNGYRWDCAEVAYSRMEHGRGEFPEKDFANVVRDSIQ